MTTSSWFRKLFARTPGTTRNEPRPFPLRLEALEDRLAPAGGLALPLAHQAAPPAANRQAAIGVQATSLVSTGSLSHRHVRLRFNTPLGQGATNPANYTIPGLSVTRVALEADRRGVRLLTSPQDPKDYTVAVTNVRASSGKPLPGPNAGTFKGLPAPTLLGVSGPNSSSLLLKFNVVLSAKSAQKPSVYSIPGLTVSKARLLPNGTDVILTTSAQKNEPYTLYLNNLRTNFGNLAVGTGAAGTFYGYPGDQTPPRVTGAKSTGNTKVVVSFTEPMSDAALNPLNYSIVQTSVNGETGVALVRSARFLDGDRGSVELTTFSQNDLTFTVSVVNVKDLAGNPFAAPQLSPGGLLIDPSRATFVGTPPSGSAIVDTDQDGVPDHVEQRGWRVTVQLTGGGTRSWWVTSDPRVGDTDGEGFSDAVELQLNIDPRAADTDGDLLTDFQEYTEIFCDHLNQDSDGDGVDDGTEFLGVFSSPTHADSDGDGMSDGDEIPNPARNPLVADLPTPAIQVGDINLALDVRFTETTSTETRELESKTVTSTLSQSESKSHSHTDSNTQEAMTRLAVAASYTFDPSLFGFVFGGNEVSVSAEVESSWTGSWTSSDTQESQRATQQAYEDSLTTDAETSVGSTVERSVNGARMQVAVFLKNASTMAFNIRNLQLTAFMYDPGDRGRLIPVATLLPESAPAEGYTLGPLVPERGPFIFGNDTIFPAQVEQLMKNPSGLVFKISNFDILDEAGRNFAFASRDVTDRTTAVVIDYGGTDTDRDGEGDLTEYNRVVVSGGRVAIDTNGDGTVDGDDHRVIFDRLGVHVGTTLRQALFNMRLKEYDESVTPSSSLSEEQLRNSYSVIKNAAGAERIFRIRTVGVQPGSPKAWELLTPQGILRPKTLDEVVLTPRSDVKLVFVQDLDGDGLPANLEFLYGTSEDPTPRISLLFGVVPTATDVQDDSVTLPARNGFNFSTGNLARVSATGGGLTAGTNYFVHRFDTAGVITYKFYTSEADALAGTNPVDLTGNITARVTPGLPVGRDTDGDGLDDRFEALVGWAADLGPLGSKHVFSSPTLLDTDGDGLTDGNEAPGNLIRNDAGLILRAERSGPGDVVTDPLNKDTDGDGVSDLDEVFGYDITLRNPPPGSPPVIRVTTDPSNPDTDGDSVADGVERRLGGNPTDPSDRDRFADDDRDGLANIEETAGWDVTYVLVSADPLKQGTAVTIHVTSDPFKLDTDGDGIPDGAEWQLRLDPTGTDTDGDGLTDSQEVRGFLLRDKGVIRTNPLDADTDDDLRTDGDEAELTDVEAKRWIVRPVGKTPYRVYSDPLQADADFDGVVDGDEYTWNNDQYRSDPNKPNTDGDSRTDGEERRVGLNPLVEDFLITVVYTSLLIQADGDGGNDAGDFSFEFDVRLPSVTSVTGLANRTIVVSNGAVGSAMPSSNDTTRSLVENVNTGLVQIRDDVSSRLNLADWLPFSGIGGRSIAFSLATNQRFSLEGTIDEFDGNNKTTVNFGGLEGVKATKEGGGDKVRTVFDGSTLTRGSVTEYTFAFDAADNIGNTSGGTIKGELKAMVIVS